MEILKSFNSEKLGLMPASAESIERANRTSGEGNSFYRGGYTVIKSVDVWDKEYNITRNGQTTRGKYPCFGTFLYDANGNFVKEGTVSVRALSATLCPNTNNAIGQFNQVKGLNGNSAVEMVKNLLDNGQCVKFANTVPACKPVWSDTKQAMDYSAMTLRDYPTFEVVNVPENVKADLAKA